MEVPSANPLGVPPSRSGGEPTDSAPVLSGMLVWAAGCDAIWVGISRRVSLFVGAASVHCASRPGFRPGQGASPGFSRLRGFLLRGHTPSYPLRGIWGAGTWISACSFVSDRNHLPDNLKRIQVRTPIKRLKPSGHFAGSHTLKRARKGSTVPRPFATMASRSSP